MTNQQPQSATTSQDTAQRVSKGNLLIDKQLFDFIEQEVLPVVQIDSDKYWQDFADIVQAFTPRNRELLAKRDQLQQQIDDWHKANPAKDGQIDREAYRAFLQDIGYLQPQGEDFSVDTQHVDDEIAHIAAPQLVVPVRNARYALNAANARWGSLYDALYGTDAISEDNGQEKGKGYNPTRGAAVIAFAKDFLDKHFALQTGSYTEVTGLRYKTASLSSSKARTKPPCKTAHSSSATRVSPASPARYCSSTMAYMLKSKSTQPARLAKPTQQASKMCC